MIKPLLLMFEPAERWEAVSRTRPALTSVLLFFVLPWLLIAAAGEGYGLIHWGKWQAIGGLRKFPLKEVLIIEAAQLILALLVVFIGANMVKAIGETIRGRHTYSDAFTAVAYGLGPLYVMRLLDAFSGINLWVSWGIGIVLSITLLYHGIPRMIKPDPSHAFGLFFITVLLLMTFTGLIRYLTAEFLQGGFPKLNAIVTSSAERLPF